MRGWQRGQRAGQVLGRQHSWSGFFCFGELKARMYGMLAEGQGAPGGS